MIINNIFCEFIQTSTIDYKCIKCGNIVKSMDQQEGPPILPCFNPLGTSRPDLSAIKNNVSSAHKNEKDLCSNEEIEHRYSVCVDCEFFKNNSCTKCGCVLNRNRIYMNKLAIKNEKCPINKW